MMSVALGNMTIQKQIESLTTKANSALNGESNSLKLSGLADFFSEPSLFLSPQRTLELSHLVTHLMEEHCYVNGLLHQIDFIFHNKATEANRQSYFDIMACASALAMNNHNFGRYKRGYAFYYMQHASPSAWIWILINCPDMATNRAIKGAFGLYGLSDLYLESLDELSNAAMHLTGSECMYWLPYSIGIIVLYSTIVLVCLTLMAVAGLLAPPLFILARANYIVNFLLGATLGSCTLYEFDLGWKKSLAITLIAATAVLLVLHPSLAVVILPMFVQTHSQVAIGLAILSGGLLCSRHYVGHAESAEPKAPESFAPEQQPCKQHPPLLCG